MLDELQVSNLALIREATLRLGPGFTVLTGETGAGKTALLSACQLLMGERADKDAVREGADELSVSGRFFIEGRAAHSADEGFREADEAADDEAGRELVVNRSVSAEGRSRVRINGVLASVRELAEQAGPLIDLCSQHEHQRLLKPTNHRRLLDRWGGAAAAEALEAYGRAFDDVRAATEVLERLQNDAERSAAELETARFTLKTIDAVAPQVGEYEELHQSLQRAENFESLARAAGGASEALAGDGGVLDRLSEAALSLQSAETLEPALADFAARAQSALFDVEDLSRELRDFSDQLAFDPQTLNEQQERMAALRGLMRSYGPRMEDVLAAREAAAEVLDADENAEGRREAAELALEAAESRLREAARALAEVRDSAAPRFAEAVSAQMERLEMGGAQLVCEVRDLPRQQWSREGSQAVEFSFKPGRRLQPRPLARIASGGELSRVMLAVKVVLGHDDDAALLVFDEIDAGVGGTAARALAGVLADLARTHQVVAITHLAQVAVMADRHYVVRRSEGQRPETLLTEVSDEARVAEIARLLSGDASATSLAHAQALLDEADAVKAVES